MLVTSCKEKDRKGVETAKSDGNKKKTKRARRGKRSEKKKDAEIGSNSSIQERQAQKTRIKRQDCTRPVSYTHLTLPTILLV